MKIGYFHCFAGAAGDMILGALLDAGLPREQLEADLAFLPGPAFRIEAERVLRQGLSATRVQVIVEEDKGPPHRRLRDIKAIVGKSGLPAAVREKSLQVFTRLAGAEARVHGTTPGKIVFHEVGAMDAIIDVVGAVAGLWRLGIEEVYASPINVGGAGEGALAKAPHGLIPIPGPATMELLMGVPAYSRGTEKELLTPTGAAILTACCRSFGEMPPLTVIANGYGAGGHDLKIPNLLRLTIGEKLAGDGAAAAGETAGAYRQGGALMLEANIDDMNPEFYDYLISRLLAAGAMDVFLQTIQMKKNRPAVTLCVMIHPEAREMFLGQIFAETTTLGVRVYPVTKYMLSYEIITMETSLGQARVKIARQEGKVLNLAPEYEDCRGLAEKNKLPLKEVYDFIKGEAYRKLSNPPGCRTGVSPVMGPEGFE